MLNIVADALFRREEDQGLLMTLSSLSFTLFDTLRASMATDPALVELQQQHAAGDLGPPWGCTDSLLTYGGCIYIPPSSPLLSTILGLAHDTGHEGIQKTLHRLCHDFHVPNARRVVEDFVRACSICQRNKSEHMHPGGLLQSLPVPSQIWADISMNFVKGLPRVHGKLVILSVVDRFSKMAHFIPLGHPYSAATVALAFFTDIVRLHGLPETIVSDRDPVFTSQFWPELFRLSGVQIHMSFAFHPQSDGQT